MTFFFLAYQIKIPFGVSGVLTAGGSSWTYWSKMTPSRSAASFTLIGGAGSEGITGWAGLGVKVTASDEVIELSWRRPASLCARSLCNGVGALSSRPHTSLHQRHRGGVSGAEGSFLLLVAVRSLPLNFYLFCFVSVSWLR